MHPVKTVTPSPFSVRQILPLRGWFVLEDNHLALNIVVAGSQGSLTPALTGAQPSVYQSGGKTIRVLAAENDKAFALLGALDEGQKKKAILNYKINDLVLGPGHDGEVIIPEGIKASSMNAKQKEMLLDLISEWAGIISNTYVDARMKEIKAGIEETYFAWSGSTTHAEGKNGSSYPCKSIFLDRNSGLHFGFKEVQKN